MYGHDELPEICVFGSFCLLHGYIGFTEVHERDESLRFTHFSIRNSMIVLFLFELYTTFMVDILAPGIVVPYSLASKSPLTLVRVMFCTEVVYVVSEKLWYNFSSINRYRRI